LAKNLIIFGRDETTQPLRKIFLKDHATSELTTLISSGAKGKPQLEAMGLSFPYCHPVGLYEELVWTLTPDGKGTVLDFFAGSGTNAHAVINLNRRNQGNRKYILVEMGHHFDTALMPRIKKAVYAEKWKDAKPVSRESRLSHMFKYQRIESYEDTLNNIEFNATEFQNLLPDEHHLRYMLESDTRESPTLLNISDLKNPFSYQLEIVTDMQKQKQDIDLPETFNYLLGLSVQTRRCLKDKDRRYLVYNGTVGQKTVVIIWRKTGGWEQQDFERDYSFIQKRNLTEGAAEVYVNTDSNVPEARSLDPLFKRLMFSE
ncbi:site-specific DNA-methyltransferase, partial [Candidatus Poribacteria bacterium]|nr:site-specific DNA-methyltransferase [Candidatus Poribacteria bacterium]